MSRVWRIELLAIGLGSVLTLKANTCHTIGPGQFGDSSIWDCGCDPMSCDTLVVGHEVVMLDQQILYQSALYILPNGALQAGVFVEFACDVRNEGIILGSQLRFSGGNNLLNQGMIECDVLLTLKDTTLNTGEITCTDSLVIGWSKPFQNEGYMNLGVLYDLGLLNNLNDISCSSAYARSFYNSGSIHVAQLLDAIGGITNEGTITGGALNSVSGIDNQGTIQLAGLLHLGTMGPCETTIGSSGVIYTGSFINGFGCFLNGPGTICIADHSENHGELRGTLDICDLSPTQLEPPFLDVNTGSFWNTVTYCANGLCDFMAVQEYNRVELAVSPIPAVDHVLVAGLPSLNHGVFVLRNLLGQVLQQGTIPASNHLIIERNGAPGGLYWLLVREGSISIATSRVVFTP